MSRPEVCRYFLRGRCTFGDKCRFLHPGVGRRGDPRDQRQRHQGDPRVDTGRGWDQRGGNRFQHLDRDRWQRDNSDRYHDNYDQYQSQNFGSQNPRYSNTGKSWSQNRSFGSRNSSMGSGSHQNWNEYSGRDHVSRNPFVSRQSDGRGRYGGLFGGNYGSSSGEGSHTQSAVDPVTPRDIAHAIQQDMEEWQSSPMWPLSCYAYRKEGECLPDFREVSQEELRWEAYQANRTGNTDYYVRFVGTLYEAQRKAWQQYSNITDDEVSRMLSGAISLFGSHSSGPSSLFAASESSGPGTDSMFGSTSPGPLFGTKPQESTFFGGKSQLFSSSQGVSGGGLFPHSDSDNRNMGQDIHPAVAQTAGTGTVTSGVKSTDSTTTSQSTDYQLTEEEVEAFKANKFVLGHIPEHAPPEVFC